MEKKELRGWSLATLLIFLFTAFSHALVSNTLTVAQVNKKVIVIPVEDEVDFGMESFLKRATSEALKQNPDYLVFKVNTFGGELGAAFEIVDLLLSIKQCSTYVFVEKKAISAGALISLASNRIAMGEGTTIGDCAPITQSQEGGIVMLGEKIQSPLRAKFRNLAEQNGYPALLSQAMVTPDMGVVAAYQKDSTLPLQYFTVKQWKALNPSAQQVFARHKVIVEEGQLLTFTDQEAAQYGFSQGSFPNFEAFLKHKKWEPTQTFATTWSEEMVRLIGKFAPILMLLGFGALYLEFKTPGLSVFGFIGVICLGIAFGSKYAVGLANHTELLLLVAGVLLFMVEIYIFPGTLIAGGLGLLLMFVALTLSMQSFTIPDPKMPWELKNMAHNLALTLGMAFLALTIPFLSARFLLPKLSGKVQVVSDTTLKDAHSSAIDDRVFSKGMVGRTKTPLRPAGKAVFGERTIEVFSRGEFIEGGCEVEIVQIQGHIVTVRAKERIA